MMMRLGLLLVTVIFADGCASKPGERVDEPREVDVDVDEEGIEARYGSTYSSNCTCSYSTMWCSMQSNVKDHGVCC